MSATVQARRGPRRRDVRWALERKAHPNKMKALMAREETEDG
jgi:hypothetical protein